MKKSTAIWILCALALIPLPSRSDEVPPIQKESRERLIKGIDALVADNSAAALICVLHDVAQKRLRILSHESSKETVELHEYGYNVEIVYNYSQTQLGGSGTYRFLYNCGALEFAAVQYSSGKKAFAIWLVGILAREEPDLFWSLPDQLLTIQQIETAMKADDKKALKPFLEGEANQ